MKDITRVDVRRAAMDLLARREHSCRELQQKLRRRFSSSEELIDAEIQKLNDEGLQSDLRLAQAMLRSRVSKGHGPMKIRSELRSRGVDDQIVALVFEESEVDWCELARQVAAKKFSREFGEDLSGIAGSETELDEEELHEEDFAEEELEEELEEDHQLTDSESPDSLSTNSYSEIDEDEDVFTPPRKWSSFGRRTSGFGGAGSKARNRISDGQSFSPKSVSSKSPSSKSFSSRNPSSKNTSSKKTASKNRARITRFLQQRGFSYEHMSGIC